MTESDFYTLMTQLLQEDNRDHLPPPGPDTDLWREGYLNSLGLLSLLVRLEEDHGLFVPADGTVQFSTVRSLWQGISDGAAGGEA